MFDFNLKWSSILPYLQNIIDISLVAFLIYHIYRLLSHSRALPVLIGLSVLIIVSTISKWVELETLSWLFELLSAYLIIAIIVILQPELRRAFYRLGHVNWNKMFYSPQNIPIEEITQACLQLAEEKTGALLVIVGKAGIKQTTESGILMQAKISKELLISIFYGDNPLHDGAVIIEEGNVVSAGTYLPLSSSSSQLKKTHGARHRAGLGITEESDVLAIVVSEEKGEISVCFQGQIRENIDAIVLKSVLSSFSANRLNEEFKTIFSNIEKKKN
ncbi:MAG: diadenylate cyclase CdaA [Spirochaetia bacterium]|nr:diadenylate cyclase CdaA [Spirochaetia bacterium]